MDLTFMLTAMYITGVEIVRITQAMTPGRRIIKSKTTYTIVVAAVYTNEKMFMKAPGRMGIIVDTARPVIDIKTFAILKKTIARCEVTCLCATQNYHVSGNKANHIAFGGVTYTTA